MRGVAIDRTLLPTDPAVLQEMILAQAQQIEEQRERLERTEYLLQQLLRARYGRKSEQLSAEQLALFQAELAAHGTRLEDLRRDTKPERDDQDPLAPSTPAAGNQRRGRQALPKHLKRERIEYDLPEADQSCTECHERLRRIGEEVSERLEYVPAQLTVVEEVCAKYACACTVKTAPKPSQPIAKSTASPSLLAQVAVSKFADHQPLNRQQKIFARHGVELSRQTMSGWMRSCAELLAPLYERLQQFVLDSKVVQTDDTPVAVLDRSLPKTRTGRIWTYVGDEEHPAVVYDYTPTRKRDGPDQFLEDYQGYLQADAYAGYDHLYADPERGMVEVACWAQARRKLYEAKDTDPLRLGTALAYIARLYAVEKDAKRLGLSGEARRLLREQGARAVLDELHAYLLQIRDQVLPKSPAGQAIAYALSNWAALARYASDGDLAIDNNGAERTMRGIAIGRKNWLFFGSDTGGRTAAVLRSFVMSCERVKLDPWAWFQDVLTRLNDHPINRLEELLPHRWKPANA
jgi:transposase